MKISYNWLKEYVDIDISPEKLSRVLTDCGLEVEELSKWESVRGGLEGVVIGEVMEVKKHPNADKLTVTKVLTGSGDPLQIVCGAPNVAAGQKVLVATVGTTLYQGDQPWEIKNAKIRGEESFGMICAEDELGLGTSHEGIMVLPDHAPVGKPAAEYFDVNSDWVYTIGLTPNRIDAASHVGTARDVAAFLNVSEKLNLSVKMPDADQFAIDNETLPVEVIVEDAKACPRYSGLTLRNLKVAPSPKWLADRLLAAGMRPINNIVDITNFVMLELGHPLHAFDMKHVKGNKIVVRKFSTPFEFITLDEVKRTIHSDDLMICNSEEGMCIAGVFGGIDAGVADNTTKIFLESACFNPVSIRKTSNRHALKTESSFRFERGTDPSMTIVALKRAAMLMKEIAGGEISSPVYDVYPEKILKARITFTHQFVNQSVGHIIPDEIQLSILRDLDFEIISTDGKTVIVNAPYAKVDVTRPADIVEEILRIYGYNNIPFPETHKSTLSSVKKSDSLKIKNVFSEMLAGNGFFEIMTNSLSSDRYYTTEFGFDENENVTLLNPLSNELNTLRRSLVFSGLESVVHNINRKQQDLCFFEFGNIYSRKSSDKNLNVTGRYHEEHHLALFMTGNVFPVNWKYGEEQMTFFHLKNRVNQLLLRSGITDQIIDSEESDLSIFGYGQHYKFKNSDKSIVQFGELSDKVLDAAECRQTVFFAQLFWENILEHLANQKIIASEPPKFPEVQRDIAILLDIGKTYDEVRSIVFNKGGKLVKAVRLFDIYEGKNIPEGKKSYAINIILQDSDKTLTDKETDSVTETVRTALIQQLGATIR
jgi:phenylalanyl-tRNA synthetase beta chain